MPKHMKAIADIHARMVALIDSHTQRAESRDLGRTLAGEFSRSKFDEGLGLEGNGIDHLDIDASARRILKKQLLVLYENRAEFTKEELRHLADLSKIIGKL